MVETMAFQQKAVMKKDQNDDNENQNSKMDWLRPHMMRIDDFCTSLGTGQTYLHIPKTMKRKCDPDDYNLSYYRPAMDNIERAYRTYDYQQSADYKRQIQSVSVIVTDKTRSLSTESSVPSPSSSLADNDDIRDETHKEGKSATYTYKPAPMAKKSKRQFISAEKKDESYWERRKRNNEAAKKSREQRREKEIEVSRKCSDLENENSGLRFTIMNLQKRNEQLESTMSLYKEILVKNNLL